MDDPAVPARERAQEEGELGELYDTPLERLQLLGGDD